MASDEPPPRVMRTKDGYVVTPESLAIESAGTKLAIRADKYLEKLEAISASQERQAERSRKAARWAATAAWASAISAAIWAGVAALSAVIHH